MHLFCESHELKNAIPEIRIHDLVYKSFQINFSPRHTTVINVIDNKEHVIIKILKIKKRPFWENNKKKKTKKTWSKGLFTAHWICIQNLQLANLDQNFV